MATNNKKIVCLFGSGISIAAGMPSVKCLTERLVPPWDAWRGFDGQWHRSIRPNWYGPEQNATCYAMIEIIRLVQECLLKDPARQDRSPNYEDVWDVLNHIDFPGMTTGDRNGENAVMCADERLEANISPFLPAIGRDAKYAVDETQNCMSDLIVELLSPDNITCVDYVRSLLSEMISTCGATNVAIVTTNHDLVLEHALDSAHIPYTRGLRRLNPHHEIWNPAEFDVDGTVKLLKPHGSVDWEELFSWNKVGLAKLGVLRKGRGLMDQDGVEWIRSDGRRRMVMGTFTKRLQYTRGYALDLIERMVASMADAQNLFICGYSFGDRYLNCHLYNWLLSHDFGCRIVVAHKDQEALLDGVSADLRENWKELVRRDVLKCIPKFIEELQWGEVEESFVS